MYTNAAMYTRTLPCTYTVSAISPQVEHQAGASCVGWWGAQVVWVGGTGIRGGYTGMSFYCVVVRIV